ncbi:MAG: hypothetical protein ACRDY0_13360, partial [Acidimicrobiales bacterium]
FVERAKAVERLLASSRTTFVVVTTLEAAPAREAELFVRVLRDKGFSLGALVLNRTLPPYLLDDGSGRRAEKLRAAAADPGALGGLAERAGAGPAVLQAVLREIGDNFANLAVVAQREASQRAELGAVPDVVVTVPELASDICDLAGVLRLGDAIWT